MNKHSAKLLAEGQKRRAKFLKLRESGKSTKELAKKEGISETRMRWMIAKAREEAKVTP